MDWRAELSHCSTAADAGDGTKSGLGMWNLGRKLEFFASPKRWRSRQRRVKVSKSCRREAGGGGGGVGMNFVPRQSRDCNEEETGRELRLWNARLLILVSSWNGVCCPNFQSAFSYADHACGLCLRMRFPWRRVLRGPAGRRALRGQEDGNENESGSCGGEEWRRWRRGACGGRVCLFLFLFLCLRMECVGCAVFLGTPLPDGGAGERAKWTWRRTWR